MYLKGLVLREGHVWLLWHMGDFGKAMRSLEWCLRSQLRNIKIVAVGGRDEDDMVERGRESWSAGTFPSP